jgi:hypothetical protein
VEDEWIARLRERNRRVNFRAEPMPTDVMRVFLNGGPHSQAKPCVGHHCKRVDFKHNAAHQFSQGSPGLSASQNLMLQTQLELSLGFITHPLG